jgi:hypothetical protein
MRGILHKTARSIISPVLVIIVLLLVAGCSFIRHSIAALESTDHFIPNKADGLIFKKTPSDFDLEPHMFYRQSMMFIRYLATLDAFGFRRFLLSVQSGDRLPDTFQATYKKKLEDLWIDFLNKNK